VSHRVSCPHTHQQNGTAERKHRHIVETGLTLLAHASVPFRFWSDAFSTTCFLINRLPSHVIDMQSPLERLLGEAPDYTFFRVFGCACWPHLRPYNNHKLDFRSKKCVFLGYSSLHKGYKCLHVPTNRVYISRDVVFDEGVFPFLSCQHHHLIILIIPLLSLANLMILHIHNCFYLTTVQETAEVLAWSFLLAIMMLITSISCMPRQACSIMLGRIRPTRTWLLLPSSPHHCPRHQLQDPAASISRHRSLLGRRPIYLCLHLR
jgi:hypothetical protein